MLRSGCTRQLRWIAIQDDLHFYLVVREVARTSQSTTPISAVSNYYEYGPTPNSENMNRARHIFCVESIIEGESIDEETGFLFEQRNE